MPVDVILVRGADGVTRSLSTDEFFAFPLNVRVRHFVERTVTFMKDGREVNMQRALAELRVLRAR
jgi:hypothetical protein